MSPEIPLDREQLEAEANQLRNRLADNLETLDQRVHDASNIKRQAVSHPVTAVLIGAGTLLAVAGGVGVIAYRARHKALKPQVLPVLSKPDADGWQHPAPPVQQNSLVKELVGRVLVSVAAFVIAQLAKRALQKHVPQLRSEPRPE